MTKLENREIEEKNWLLIIFQVIKEYSLQMDAPDTTQFHKNFK